MRSIVLFFVLFVSTPVLAAEATSPAVPAPAMPAAPMVADMSAPLPLMEPVMASVVPMSVDVPMSPAVMAPVAAVMEPPKVVAPDPVMEPVTSEPPVPAPTSVLDATTTKPATPVVQDMTPPTPAATPTVKSKDAKAADWLGILKLVLLGFIGVLMTLGLLSWTKKDRALKIMKMADKILDSLAEVAKSTPFKWDDALVQLLKDINTRLIASGEQELSDSEKAALKTIADTRKPTAATVEDQPSPTTAETDSKP